MQLSIIASQAAHCFVPSHGTDSAARTLIPRHVPPPSHHAPSLPFPQPQPSRRHPPQHRPAYIHVHSRTFTARTGPLLHPVVRPGGGFVAIPGVRAAPHADIRAARVRPAALGTCHRHGPAPPRLLARDAGARRPAAGGSVGRLVCAVPWHGDWGERRGCCRSSALRVGVSIAIILHTCQEDAQVVPTDVSGQQSFCQEANTHAKKLIHMP